MEKSKNLEENANDIIDTAMQRLKDVIDVNTVVGSIIVVDADTRVLPISKVSVGFVAGGGELNTKSKKVAKLPFAGGSGSGFTVEPMGFLIFTKTETKYVSTETVSPLNEVVKISNSILAKIMKDKKGSIDEESN